MQTAAAPERERLVHVVQGQFQISDDPSVVLSTVLGSCVAACVRDPLLGFGGMNHFLLPGDTGDRTESMKYGLYSMELLINGLLQRGASRNRLEAKLFGGARVVEGLSDIGRQNAVFAERFLREEGIRCTGQSLGGDRPRRIRFWPTTGRVAQLLLEASSTDIFHAERSRAAAAPAPPASGALELF
ncbi:MAG: chemotaxis protein CheD [Hyphomonadaceae bacterium]